MSFKKTKEIMAARRASAEKRQEAYDKLTIEQKLAKLPPEPHAARERAKLLKKLEASKKPAQKEEKKVEAPVEVPTKKSKKNKKEDK